MDDTSATFRNDVILQEFLSNMDSDLIFENDQNPIGSYSAIGARPRNYNNLVTNNNFKEFLKFNFSILIMKYSIFKIKRIGRIIHEFF